MPKHAERRNMPEGPHLCMQMTNFTWLTSCSCGWVVCMLEMLSAKTSLTTCGIVVVVVVTLSSAMSASAASFHVGLRSPNQNELHCTDRFFPRWAKTTRATRDDPMTASLPWLTSCSCVVVVCVLELLSATSSWAKATKTERQERQDESLHARNRICHVCAAQPRERTVDVSLRHACHAKRPWMCNCATPATWNQGGCHQVPRLPRRSGAASRAPKPSPSAPPSAISATPATQNDGRCEVVPRLPREIKVDVTKCHACHAEVARRHGRHGRLNQVQARHPVPCVPRLPRKTTVDVRVCHACHVKGRWMWVCATPATWNQGGCHQVPRLPRRSGAASRASRAPKPSPSAPPSAISATPATQNDGRCENVPRLPRERTVDVSLCHACHVKSRWSRAPKPSPSAPPSAISATPATQNDGRCEVVPRLPRKVCVPRLPRKTTVDVRVCHACHVKGRWMWVCATPATWNQGGCHQVPRLPRRSGAASQASRAPKPSPSAPPSAISATPATQNDGRCEGVPRLPRERTVDVSLCHACHVKSRWMSPSATPATQKWRGVTGVTGA